MMHVLINSMSGILLQYMCISNRHIVHFKYLTILPFIFTSVELEKKEATGNW